MPKHQKKIKRKIEGIISDYFYKKNKLLQQTYLLVDIRLKPQQYRFRIYDLA